MNQPRPGLIDELVLNQTSVSFRYQAPKYTIDAVTRWHSQDHNSHTLEWYIQECYLLSYSAIDSIE